jgi:hypothetical protein
MQYCVYANRCNLPETLVSFAGHVMITQIFNFPILEFCWYGILSLMSLSCFASLSYEVKRGIHAGKNAGDEDAVKVVWATYHMNFIAMVIANIALVPTCLGISACDGEEWRSLFAGSIFACGAYWFYTRACEKKLIVFLETAGVYSKRRTQA